MPTWIETNVEKYEIKTPRDAKRLWRYDKSGRTRGGNHDIEDTACLSEQLVHFFAPPRAVPLPLPRWNGRDLQ